MKRKKGQQGFTLIELLIVVVIIAILAALIMPRFLTQVENGYIAEAQDALGKMRRAYVRTMDSGGGAPVITDASLVAEMAVLGLTSIPATNFTYSCTAAGLCTAVSVRNNANQISLSLTGTFTCSGQYRAVAAGNDRGCRM